MYLTSKKMKKHWLDIITKHRSEDIFAFWDLILYIIDNQGYTHAIIAYTVRQCTTEFKDHCNHVDNVQLVELIYQLTTFQLHLSNIYSLSHTVDVWRI